MKSLSDKITAIIIYLVLAEFVVGLFLAIDCMAEYRFYSGDGGRFAREETMRVLSKDEFENIENCIVKEVNAPGSSGIESTYSEGNSNVNFAVYKFDGSLFLHSSAIKETSEAKLAAKSGDYAYCSIKPFKVCDAGGNYVEGKIYFMLEKGLPAHDEFRRADNLINTANIIRYPILALLAILVISSVLVLGIIMSSISRKGGEKGKETPDRFIDKIPLDLLILIIGTIIGFVATLIVLTDVAGIKHNNLVLWNAIVLILTLVISSTLLLFTITLATRIKYGHVYRNTLVFKIIKGIRKKRGKENEGYFKVPFAGKMLITIILFLSVEIIVTLYYLFQYKINENNPLSEFKFTYFAIFQLVVFCVIGALFFMISTNLYHLRVSSKKLAKGVFDPSDDSEVLFGDFREISYNFEEIKDDMMKALEEKNKSAEMRNELIANISHDIKTPLTSIINYADIVSSGGCTEEELKNYLGVISHQSQKLNNLLQNLIEVSKLSSGTIEANFESLDIGLYLSQILDEFLPMLSEKGLETELKVPEKSVYIKCDSSMLWRIFENLINNIRNYAMPDSRVYIDVEKKEDTVSVSLRNTSASKITVSAEELLQRFKRNDKSRSGGGNGLGLSIAKSFTEIQNGTFELFVDGDLFKTVLTFKLSENK